MLVSQFMIRLIQKNNYNPPQRPIESPSRFPKVCFCANSPLGFLDEFPVAVYRKKKTRKPLDRLSDPMNLAYNFVWNVA